MVIAHFVVAFIAACLTGTDPTLLLTIAWHESRWTSNVVSPEPGKRVSCGAMTPMPVARCRDAPLLEQYLSGARHLRTWMDVCEGAMPCALRGYAGGFSLIYLCAREPGHAGCDVWLRLQGR